MAALAGLCVLVTGAASQAPSAVESPAPDAAPRNAAAHLDRPAVPVPPWLLGRLDRAVEHGIRDGITPGAALVVGFGGQVAISRTWGTLDWSADAPAVTDSTIYDLASLTKAVATTTVAMHLVERRRLDLDAPISTYLKEWPSTGAKGRITARHLLTHTSGLPAAARLWRSNRGEEAVLNAIAELPLDDEPGHAQVYSDLGMIVLGTTLERIAGRPLDELTREWVAVPLGLKETTFRPLSAGLPRARIAPTELNRRTGKKVRGTVHDPNAAAMSGVAGHAGLFGSARDLSAFASAILWGTPGRIACRSTVDRFASRDDPTSRFGLGWEKPVPDVIWSDFFTDAAYGHTGFTGTSLWIDPAHDLFVVFLTNRLDSTRGEDAIHDLRRWVHRAVHGWIVDPMSAPAVSRAATLASPPVRPADLCRVAEGPY